MTKKYTVRPPTRGPRTIKTTGGTVARERARESACANRGMSADAPIILSADDEEPTLLTNDGSRRSGLYGAA